MPLDQFSAEHYQYSYKKQTTWGTALTNDPVLISTKKVVFAQKPTEHVFDRAHGVAGETEAARRHDLTASVATATMDAFPLTKTNMEGILPALLNNTTDWAAASNVYTYFPVLPAALPICASSDGYFFTLHKISPQASDSEQMKDAVCRSMKISLHPTDNAGLLCVASSEWIGTAVTLGVNLSQSTTYEDIGTENWKWGSLAAATWDGTSILADFTSFEADLTWNQKFQDDLPTKDVLFQRFECKGQFTMSYNSATDAMRNSTRTLGANLGKVLRFAWGSSGTPDSEGDLTIDFFCYLTDDVQETDNGKSLTFNFVGLYGANPGTAAGENPVTFKLYDAP